MEKWKNVWSPSKSYAKITKNSNFFAHRNGKQTMHCSPNRIFAHFWYMLFNLEMCFVWHQKQLIPFFSGSIYISSSTTRLNVICIQVSVGHFNWRNTRIIAKLFSDCSFKMKLIFTCRPTHCTCIYSFHKMTQYCKKINWHWNVSWIFPILLFYLIYLPVEVHCGFTDPTSLLVPCLTVMSNCNNKDIWMYQNGSLLTYMYWEYIIILPDAFERRDY